MLPKPNWSHTLLALVLAGAPAVAGEADPFAFFDAEARVITASLRPQTQSRAPATVHVVTSEDIKASGAQTLWDALRSVPGVDVMATRTFHGEVSIRGLNKSLNNRCLVLLDGKTVLNGFFDFVTWESIPVELDQIDRIEIVEGAASALHGANAINGVINIITKKPEQMEGALLRYGPGAYRTRLATFMLGGRKEAFSYRGTVGWRTGRQFGDESLTASDVRKLAAMARYETAPDASVTVSGGISDLNTQLSGGLVGTLYEVGRTGFIRTDVERGATRARLFWNRGRTVARDFVALRSPALHYDTYDVNLEHSLPVHRDHSLVVGAGYRKNVMDSEIFSPRRNSQDLWALFFEDTWMPQEAVDVVISGRLDRHPLAGAVFSPRGSVIFRPVPEHTWRASAGTAFRNPTLTENYVRFNQTTPNPGTSIPNPPYSAIDFTVLGNRDLDPEKLLQFELAHVGGFRKLRTTATLFHYRLRDVVSTTTTHVAGAPPAFTVVQSFTNHGQTTAWGGELGAEVAVAAPVRAFANVSYQKLEDDPVEQGTALSSPRRKANLGVRVRSGGLTSSLTANVVGGTSWLRSLGAGYPDGYRWIDRYTLINLGVNYGFSGPLSGLEVGLSAFNLGNHRHYQTLPVQSPTEPGQNGEVIGRRILGSLSYSF